MSLVAAVIGTLNLIILVLLWKKSSQGQNNNDLQERLGKNTADLAERIAKSAGETRTALVEGLSKEFLSTWEKLSGELKSSRQDQENRLKETAVSMEKRLEEIRNKVDERLIAIESRVQVKLDQNIKQGFEQYEKMQEHLKSAQKELQNLSQVSVSVSELNNLLKLPHLRGAFGETTLESILSDFLPAGSYELQKGAEGNSRPDAVINFPKAKLPIDSKFPREQVLGLFETSDPQKLEAARVELERVVKFQAKQIHDKYIRPQDGYMDMGLMFLPSETLYFEVVRNGELWNHMSKLRVFPVSPNTLAITLKSISIAQDYYSMSQNVAKILEDINKAKKHYDNFQSRFEEIGDRLQQAQDAFTKANTNLGRYSSSVTRLTGDTEDVALPAPEQVL